MLYENYSQKAIYELERQRTGNYGYDIEEYEPEFECKECKTHTGMFFEINSEYYCADCVCDYLREQFSKFSHLSGNEMLDSGEILNEIISDFSDNELLSYIESKYQRIDT